MATNNTDLNIEVVYASTTKQKIISIIVQKGTTIKDAIVKSGIQEEFIEIIIDDCQVAVFGKKKLLNDIVEHGDRIEICRALIIDPKEARRARAKKQVNQS